MPSFRSVAVIGAGAWGTALAGVAARAGRDVVLYARQPERAAETPFVPPAAPEAPPVEARAPKPPAATIGRGGGSGPTPGAGG